MENFESFNKQTAPDSLKYALSSLCNNANPVTLRNWIKENGIQNGSFEINSHERKSISNLIDFNMRIIEKELDYKTALYHWKLLSQSGLLTQDVLKLEINNYIQENMAQSTESIEQIKNNVGIVLSHYSEEFIQEFKHDLEENIKQEIGWEISI